jgi:hypothetical protein
MIFDAQSARALSRRTHTLADGLAAMKKAIIEAARAGEFEASVGLAEPVPIVAGKSTNNAAFLIDFFTQQGSDAWADAVQHALRAGYAARPFWTSVPTGAAVGGIVLSWYLIETPEEPLGGDAPLLLMAAQAAYAMSQAEQVHYRWVDALKTTISKAALQGKSAVTVHDAAAAADPAWAKRREILQRAGFSTELVAVDRGAGLTIRW